MPAGLSVEIVGDNVPKMMHELPAEYAKARKKSLRKGAQKIVKFWKLRLSGPAGARRLGVGTGDLRRSIQAGPVVGDSIKVGTDKPYAAVHEFGFDDWVHVRQHTRTNRWGTHTVGQHARRMRMPKRPHRAPAVRDARPVVRLIFGGDIEKANEIAKRKAGRIKRQQIAAGFTPGARRTK